MSIISGERENKVIPGLPSGWTAPGGDPLGVSKSIHPHMH